MLERSGLVREYVTALRQKSASIFLGAGMSMSVFNTNWHDLMKPYARIIKLPLKKDGNNYPLIAQAYVDGGNDILEFKRRIGEKFNSDEVCELHKVIARLPIQNYWTTNYDSLIENALAKSNKHFDMIYDNHSFGTLDDKRDHIVYKFHGDRRIPESIIITKKDYEDYPECSNNFVSALNKELASSSILFLGYSFNDPNINNIISTLTAKNGKSGNHFMITKRKRGSKAKEQEVWLKDIERYGINALLIDN
ncbi:MAG: SIR2 family protein, partial [Muribaculaceae bacterium]|nr:SIR2 family protein [Muribaculaceae bacterium]